MTLKEICLLIFFFLFWEIKFLYGGKTYVLWERRSKNIKKTGLLHLSRVSLGMVILSIFSEIHGWVVFHSGFCFMSYSILQWQTTTTFPTTDFGRPMCGISKFRFVMLFCPSTDMLVELLLILQPVKPGCR